jgi:hypothetical protein
MQLLNKTVENFSSANYIIASLNRAINTTYIPSGDTIQEVINNFSKRQLQRSFDPACGGQADLELIFNEKHLIISYSSTSGTSVGIWYIFNNNMEVEKIEVSVWIPDDRAESGRCHYECLTQELYRYDFLKVDWESHKAEIELPYSLIKLNDKEDWDIPNWVYEQQSNFIAHWNPDKTVSELSELGYVPVNNVIGYKAAYHNPNHYIQYIVVNVNLHEVDNNYYLLHDANDKINFNNGGVSYLRLIEMIKSAVNRKVEVEDYEYDNGYNYDEE